MAKKNQWTNCLKCQHRDESMIGNLEAAEGQIVQFPGGMEIMKPCAQECEFMVSCDSHENEQHRVDVEARCCDCPQWAERDGKGTCLERRIRKGGDQIACVVIAKLLREQEDELLARSQEAETEEAETQETETEEAVPEE
jgi:hypothetical protein